jgi:hypothetical protein
MIAPDYCLAEKQQEEIEPEGDHCHPRGFTSITLRCVPAIAV